MSIKHPTYAINLKERPDRLAHIQNEFKNRDEFKLNIISAKRNKNGALNLWKNITKVIKKAQKTNYEYVIICEDDHQFTKSYSTKKLNNYILEAKQKNVDILVGGVSWFNTSIQVSNNLFWADQFSGLQFTVIFKQFFDVILNAEFKESDAADYKISELSNHKMVIYPFISTQKEFGYSDVTLRNNKEGRVNKLFKGTKAIMSQMVKVKRYYNALPKSEIMPEAEYANITIPTYIINLPKRTERLKHIKKQFEGRAEFDVTIIEACKHEIGAVGLWQSIRKVVEIAIQNDDDVIIICEDDHEFTEHYNWDFFIKQILEGNNQGVGLLNGGIGGFVQAVPITANRFWVNSFFSTQFIVLYKSIFQKILDEPFDDKVTADGLLSELTSHKMALYPLISVQKEFGYSDVTAVHNNRPGNVKHWFMNTEKRLEVIQKAYLKFLQFK